MAALLTLAQAKEALNMTAATNDAEVTSYVEAATDMIESRIGPVINRTVTETLTATSGVLVLSYLPVVSITTVVGVFSGALTYLPAVLNVNPTSGIVGNLDRTALRADTYTVTYVAGRGATISPRFVQAARVLLQHLWSTQRSGGSRPGAASDGQPGVGYSMPNRVLELIERDLLIPSVG